MMEIEDNGWALGAIYHSHTRSPAYPSQTDVNLAFYPDALYVIVSLQDDETPGGEGVPDRRREDRRSSARVVDVGSMASMPLACPRCATRYSLDERFCSECGMPLTYAGRVGDEEPVTEQHERARKVKPQYARGELSRVATARQQAEAEFIQMLLLEEGVPSTLRRTGGFDVPDFLAAGPARCLVPESGLEVARDVLQQSDIAQSATGSGGSGAPSARRSRSASESRCS